MAKATNKKAAASSASPKKAAAVQNLKKANAVKRAAAPKKAAATGSSPKKAAAMQNLKKANAVKKAAAPAPKKAAVAEDSSLLEELFVDSLKDIYWAEKALTKALPKLAKAATSEDLRGAFQDHLTQTEEQVQRLEQVFELIGKKAQAKKCEAMAGLTKEADEMVASTKKGTETRDVALIMAAQKVEHYEIATYGSLATLAAQLGYSEAKDLLAETLQEEKDTDSLLTELAESHINEDAANDEEEGDEDGEEEDETEDDEASGEEEADDDIKA